ncbi:GNAT family N-acetyltransferase [Kitasatospora sp. A2-31]|uniref:GNAT family N-acetyltransferase n=1 Tax=Kitasatospora sp. A2-31 TaxID=2916414 RepID=UPI001EEB0697|nr:N-acetyltransferase [Kitasatospora sp. A2-31]MCG6495686.1 GNAT family N-acetyltransferase [Kitasatospora sp. A2-31]
MSVPDPRVRPATPQDADELLRLRVAVLTGEPVTDHWRTTFRDDMLQRLGNDPDLLAYVADGPGGSLTACAVGIVYRGYCGPTYPTGQWARIHTVVTDPGHRRQGLARAVTSALVTAIKQRGCSIELRATDAGAPLYRSLGFEPVDGFMALRSTSPGRTG